MFTLEQVMVKNSVNVSSITTIKDVSQILANGALHALPVADDFKLVELLP
jgi:CBS-domain-containing membrane protein|tara:strand:- start:512 stop:661 length:150 start_codon:yes stop_codon:yes gene_type:complete